MLEKGKRSIFAYFPSSINADKASKELKGAGIPIDEGSIAIDRISRYNMRMDDERNQPVNNALTLSGPVLYSSSPVEGPNPLLAASDSASGIGNPDAGAAGGTAFLLTVVTKEERVREAMQIIKENGGRV
ncbi:MAG TPA: hypothetical protein PLG09_06235 [Syntrophomonadaceae bacterium]|nr:hypothetical protein [Syntrophomonadaceae bacterium]HPU48507.1 hypothetical protein [Syntrophomonadaceae bacterium]